MSIILSKEILSRSLEIVEKALSRQSPLLPLKNIHFESSSQSITLSATNMELQIKVILPYEGEYSGKALLPPQITEIVRLMPSTEISLDVDPENYQVNLTGGRTRYNLFGADPADFPAVEKLAPAEGETMSLDPAEFSQILKMVIFAASTEESRPAFNGVLFEFKEDRLSLICSDTYRLVVKNVSAAGWNFTPRRCLVPAKALRELLRILDQSEDKVLLYTDGKKMAFDLGSVYFAAALLNEKYPDISSVIPQRFSTRISLNRSEMEKSVVRAALLAEAPNYAINLFVGRDAMKVRVSSQVGRMEEELSIEGEGEEVDLYVNSRFIMDILRAAPAETLIVEFNGKNGPIVFRLPEDESYLYLVLPIKMD
ncbi:MAG: DNA polymerase III subunit beta [Firmicutes bacterium]|jgi:DNA polymerase-3 subunit beta|nr:DNA polymerase III subunit beta [Bacillota bacterium]HPU00549.1 DNA polymerase III subunit beta [Bacillota bacterium]